MRMERSQNVRKFSGISIASKIGLGNEWKPLVALPNLKYQYAMIASAEG